MLRICACFVLFAAQVAASDLSGRVSVTDGDTIEVGGVTVRLHGIDAPETRQTCETEQGAAWDCGLWVNTQVRAMYQGRRAKCDAVTTDRYGRVVATCFVDGEDMGRRLVQEGLAFAYRKYSMAYDLDEKGAAVNDRGLHASRVQSPAQFRQTRAVGRLPPGECRIKGNISSKGTRIYHVPGQENYERTGIREEKGERWFCTEAEARAAGWRKAKR